MSQEEKDTESRQNAQRRHSAGGTEEGPRIGSGTRRGSLTQGIKDGGRKVKATVEAMFKDDRLDLEDDPEFVKIRPTWEEDLQKYLPLNPPHQPPKDAQASSSSAAAPQNTQQFTLSTTGGPSVEDQSYLSLAALNAFATPGTPKVPQTLAAHRWHKAYEWVKRHNAMKKRALTTPIGTGAKLDGHALGVVPVEDGTRRALFDLLYQPTTEYVIVGLIAGHLIVLILKAESKFITPYIPPKAGLDAADIILTTFYTVEMLSRIYCLGLWRGPHTYLRNPFNKLDLVVVVDSWIHIARTVILKKDAFLRIAILRVFRILISFRHLSAIGNTIAIMDAILKSIYSLETVFILTIMLLSFFAMVGVQFFGGRLIYRCVRDTDGQVSYPMYYCMNDTENPYGYLCPESQFQYCVGGRFRLLNSALEEHFENPIPLKTYPAIFVTAYENPSWGVSSWDNYGTAMLILIQVWSWTICMNSMFDVYFCIFVVIGAYFIMNIYVAAVSSVFLRVRHEHQILLKKHRKDKAFSFANAIHMANLLKETILRDDNYASLSWSQKLRYRTSKQVTDFRRSLSKQGSKLRRSFTKAVDWNDPNSYLRRISDGSAMEAGQFSQSPPPQFGRSLSRNLSIGGQRAAQLGRTFSRTVSLRTIMAARTLSEKCALIVNSKFFMYAVLLVISLNMAGLCTFRAKMSEQHIKRLEIMEIIVLIVFSAEMILRFVAQGVVDFVDEQMNIVDVCIIIISWSVIGFGHAKKFPNLTPIRMMRWFYVRRRRNEDVEHTSIVVTVMRSVGSVFGVFFFLVLVIFVFSIMSMELWGGQFSNFEEGYPRANHDTFFQAMLLWFSVTTAESWPDNMWNTMRPGVPNRFMGPIMFVVYYLITALVILNLLMAVILEQTELTDNQKRYIQKSNHIKYLQTKHRHHASHTRNSEWLVKSVEGAQKGYEGIKRRMSTMKVSRMSLFPVFQPETGFVRMMSAPPVESPKYDDVVPERIFGAVPSPAEATETKAPFRRHSYVVNIPGSAATTDFQEQDKTKARIFRRSSFGALSSAGLLPQSISGLRARRHSHTDDADKVLLRSGFKDIKPAAMSGENRTALQDALLNVIQDEREASAIEKEDKKRAAEVAAAPLPTGPKPSLEKFPSRKSRGPRLSFSMSDFEGIQVAGEREDPWWMSTRSLFLFEPDNRFRVLCAKIAENKWNLYWQYIVIFASCFVVVETTVLGDCIITYGKSYIPTCNALEYITVTTFTLDFVTKVVAYGFLFAPDSYLSDPFNFLDLFSLVIHYARLTSGPLTLIYSTYLLMACTRPIRFIVRVKGLRNLTIPIIKTIPAISQVFVFTVVVYSIFAIIGMQLYGNRFRTCTDPSVVGHADCVGFFKNSVGILAPRTWINPPFHFDAFGESMLALFVASTFDNWLEYFAYPSMDLAHQQELQPQRNQSPSHALFFVSFMCIGGFFILRMFIGVFIDQFGIISGSKLLTERQKLFRDTNRIIQSLKPTRLPKHYRGLFRGTCSMIVHSRKFEILIVVVILINYGYIVSQHSGQRTSQRVFDKVEIMFVTLYIIEALLKFVGTQFSDWWHHKWNLGELVLVIFSAACLWPPVFVPGQVKDSIRHMIGAFIYSLRIFRIVRYIPQLDHMVSTIFISLPGMIDIVSYMGIVIFFFAGLGTNLFTTLKHGTCYNGLDLSFATFTQSFVTLFQIVTLDNWSCVLVDIVRNQPWCRGPVNGVAISSDCGLSVGGIVFLLLLICITNFIFASIFVAQIIDTITFGLLDEHAMLTPAHLFNYQKLWAQKQFDYNCTGYIGQHKLREFLFQLGPPLGRRLTFRDKWTTRIEYEALHFRNSKGIPFKSLLETLVVYKIGPRGLELPVRIERERQIQGVYRNGAATKIQALARGYLERKRGLLRRSKRDKETEQSHEDDRSKPQLFESS